jgi:hypothetical protein
MKVQNLRNWHVQFIPISLDDGHGDFEANSTTVQTQYGKLGQGVLVFEDAEGNPQIVTAREIAQYLTDCRVPIFLLNACKSGQAGEEPFF